MESGSAGAEPGGLLAQAGTRVVAGRALGRVGRTPGHWFRAGPQPGQEDADALADRTRSSRDPGREGVDEASPEESNDCFVLWDEVGGVLRRIAMQARAIVLDPKRSGSPAASAKRIVRQGRLEECAVAWQTALEGNPLDHNAWFGYAELCLFLGREDEYRRAHGGTCSRGFLSPTIRTSPNARGGPVCSCPRRGMSLAAGRRPRPARRGVRPVEGPRCVPLVRVRPGPGGIS